MKSLFLLFSQTALALTLQLPTEEATLSQLRATLANKGETVERTLKRLGDKTIELEAFLATEGDMSSATKILSKFEDYGVWALKNINQTPRGTTYRLKINSLHTPPADPNLLVVGLAFDIPLFHKTFDYPLRVNANRTNDVLTLTAESLPEENSPVKSVETVIRIFPGDGSKKWLWAYLKGQAKLRSWLMYEALPEKLLQRETAERFQRIMDNYHGQESKLKK